VIARVLLLWLLAWPIAAFAQSSVPAMVAPDPVETPAEALTADAAEYAAAYAVAPAEALRRLRAQEASVPLLVRLAEAYRDRLAGVVVQHRPDYRILLMVTGPPAPDVQVATAPFDVPVAVRSGALATRDQLIAAIEQHQAALRAALPTPPGLAPDPATGALLVLVRPGDVDPDEAETLARLQRIAGVSVEIRNWRDADDDLGLAGGGRLVGSDAGDPRRFVCTGGFAVTDGSRDALATAAHCPDTLSLVGRDGRETPTTMIGAWGAATQDVQLHDPGTTLLPDFHGDDRTRVRVVQASRSRRLVRAGDWVCHQGQRTGYSCAAVRFPDFAPPGDLCAGPCPATWVAVAGPRCKGGDSGGPVFLGTTAFGLVKGETSQEGQCQLYYYMPVDFLPAGWRLLEAPATLFPPG
jgi:hypothetical protein